MEKKNYIEDWIIHYASQNPVYEQTPKDDIAKMTLFVKEKQDSRWDNLYLVGDSWGWNLPKHRFNKIKNTNWWFISFDRPKGSRLHYLLSPNDPSTKITEFDRAERRKNWFFDTRNKLSVDGVDRIHSVATFPEFTNSFEVTTTSVDFKPMRIPKKLQGSRTAKYSFFSQKGDEDIPKHLLFVHDGDAANKYMNFSSILQTGIDNGRWPSVVFVPLTINDDERTQEYGGREGYPDFFANTLIPTTEEILNLNFDPKNITIMGTGLGGWAAFDVAWNEPDAVKNVICHSSPWWWAENNDSIEHSFYITEIKDSKKEKLDKIYIDCGVFETGKIPLSTYDSNRKFAAALSKKKYNFMAREVLMGHRYQNWAWSVIGALDFVFNGEKEYGPLPGRQMSK